MQRRTQPGWSNPRVLTIFALIFFCGAAFGGAVVRSYLHRVQRDPHYLSIESARHMRLDLLKSELQLTPEQEHFVAQELDDYGKYYQNIEDERRDVAEHGRQRILDRLNNEQKRKFNDLFGQPMSATGGAAAAPNGAESR
jgi:hypothetical protein